jgi:hypothetical protein
VLSSNQSSIYHQFLEGAFFAVSHHYGDLNMPDPLFITDPSLSSRTATGVQLKLLLEDIPVWRHLFWNGAEFRSLDPRSTRIESALFCRLSFFKRDPMPPLGQILARAGFSRWNGNEPKPGLVRWLRKEFRDGVSVVYVSPCSTREAERTKALLIALEKPFVVHLWDMLDANQTDSEAFRWLIEKAEHVFCVSESMVQDIAPFQPRASILRFARKPSLHRATAPAGGPLRIALIGFCSPYQDGLVVLNEALKIVRQKNREVEVVYIGSKKRLKGWSRHLDDQVIATGFMESDEKRDLLLSQCHVGFLPGPLASPVTDTRSRYSIPSRVLDFMATGLAITGTIHPDGATSTYMATLGLEDCLGTNSPELLAERLLSFYDPSNWQFYSDLSVKGFAAAQRQNRAFKDWLQDAGATISAV